MVRLAGFEPATTRLEGGCSIQLSYRRKTVSALYKSGRSERIRTFDPLNPNQVRYQTAPRSDTLPLKLPSSAG